MTKLQLAVLGILILIGCFFTWHIWSGMPTSNQVDQATNELLKVSHELERVKKEEPLPPLAVSWLRLRDAVDACGLPFGGSGPPKEDKDGVTRTPHWDSSVLGPTSTLLSCLPDALLGLPVTVRQLEVNGATAGVMLRVFGSYEDLTQIKPAS